MKLTKAAGTPNLTRPAFVCQDGFRSTWRHWYSISSCFSRKSWPCQGEAYPDFGATCLVPRWFDQLCGYASQPHGECECQSMSSSKSIKTEEQELPLRWWHFEVVPKMPSPEALAAARRLQGHVHWGGNFGAHDRHADCNDSIGGTSKVLLKWKPHDILEKIPDCLFAWPKLIVWEVAQWIDLHDRLQPSCSSPYQLSMDKTSHSHRLS